MTQLDQDDIWKIVKRIRISFLSKYEHPQCNYLETLLSDENIKDITKSLADGLNLNISTVPRKNVTDESLQTAAQIFTYLNFCPPKKIPSLIMLVFKNSKPKDIIFALKSIIKTSNILVKKSSVQILSKFMEDLSLNQYKAIQIITKGKSYNEDTIK